MKKDVIYIDIEDDITAVIEKLKESKEKIIALVPPKGNAVLQSTVNLKLLKRAAESVGKQPVVVTNNHALTALAGGLGLYVAKNLQSKPAVPSVDEAAADDEEAVEVSEPVGKIDDKMPVSPEEEEMELSPDEVAALQSGDDDTVAAATAAAKTPKNAKAAKSKGKKIPNFDTFRKKLLIGGGIALLLLLFGVLVFGRSKANIVMRAQTTPVDVLFDAKLNANASASDPATYELKSESQEVKKSLTQAFTATGQKDLGTKASGSMTLSIACNAVSSFPVTIPSGTTVTASGLSFVTQSAATLSSPGGGGGGCKFSGNTTVAAQNNGDQYNLGPTSYSVSGYSSVSGSGGQMSGGTSKIVKVVAQADVDKAKEQLNQQDSTAIKKELKEKFGKDTKIFEDSFITSFGTVTSSPSVGQEGESATLTAQVSYTMLGVANDDLSKALNAFIETKMNDKDRQRIYDNGFKNINLEKISADAKTATYKVTSLGYYGPQFDTNALKQQVAGKKYGEIRSMLSDLPGVKGVDIKLSPFWARKAPNASRINIELEVDNSTSGT
jgi:hypothetical protein